MKLAGDDADGDLTLGFSEGVTAGVEMGAEWPRDLCQVRIVHPDFARPGEAATALDHSAIALLLRRSHLLVGNLCITTKGWCFGHIGFLPSWAVMCWGRVVVGPPQRGGVTVQARGCSAFQASGADPDRRTAPSSGPAPGRGCASSS